MQLLIESHDTPYELRLASAFLAQLAEQHETKLEATSDVPSGTNAGAEALKTNSTLLIADAPTPPPVPANVTAVSSAAAPTQIAAAPASRDNAASDAEPNYGASAPAFDKSGLPWDERIHAGGKGLNKDGTWRLRRNVETATVQAVVAELRASGKCAPTPTGPAILAPNTAIPTGAIKSFDNYSDFAVAFGSNPPPPPPPPALSNAAPSVTVSLPGSVPVPPVQTNTAPSVPGTLPPQLGAAGSVPVQGQPAVGHVPTFREIMQLVVNATAEGKLTNQQVDAICQAAGCPNIMMLNSLSNLIPQVYAGITAALNGQTH
jgi:hypothetical protein